MKKPDIILLILFPILSVVMSLFLKANLLFSCLLFFGLPSLYLAIRNPRIIYKTAIFSFLFSVPLVFIFDYLLVRDNAWYIISTAFPFRLFDVVALEQFVFGFLWIYFIISMYECFFDRKEVLQRNRLVSKQMLLFGLLTFSIVFLLIAMILVNSSTIVLPYAYSFLGIIVGVIPLSLFLYHFPRLYSRFIKITAYFLVLALLVEYVGLKLDQWIFSGSHYLFTIKYFGIRIPIEEVLFYFVLSTPGILSYYEYLDDDRR